MIANTWTSRYDPSLRQLLMLSRTENPYVTVLVFADRDADKDNPNQGYCLVFGATGTRANHGRFSSTHVPADGAGGSAMG
jgi:hypothetical protein